MSVRSLRRLSAALCLPLLAGLALLPAPRPAAAQEEPRAAGWLGLGLEEHLECRVTREGSEVGRPGCERRIVVARLVADGPAHRAGVRPGDTLLALDGRALQSSEMRERALSALRPGQPVRVTLGRASGRMVLRVVPTERPVRFGAAPRERRAPAPRLFAATEREERAREVLEIVTDGGEVIRIRRQGATPRRAHREAELLRWVELQLGPEFQALQDSVFRGARAQMMMLRQLHARRIAALRSVEAGTATELERARDRLGALSERGVPAAFRERRMAGAEFETLEPELAEFFETDRGLLVLRVLPDTPADRAGLRAGDVVVEAGGAPVLALEDLRRALLEEEGPLSLTWNRKGRILTGSLRE